MTHLSRAMFTPVAVDCKSGQLKIKKPSLSLVFHSFFTKELFSRHLTTKPFKPNGSMSGCPTSNLWILAVKQLWLWE